ncbi:MAG: hypothetical protein GEV07_06355 [Streptosporangiales bacterium]|nr:hypothetical protein [Streptosporangiales bacterium]
MPDERAPEAAPDDAPPPAASPSEQTPAHAPTPPTPPAAAASTADQPPEGATPPAAQQEPTPPASAQAPASEQAPTPPAPAAEHDPTPAPSPASAAAQGPTPPVAGPESVAPAGEPPAPLFGTRESAAGLPYATSAGAGGSYQPGLGPPPVDALAPPGRRLAARVIDTAIVGLVLSVLQTALWVVIFLYSPRLRQLATDYVNDPTGELQTQLQQAITPWAWLSAFVVLAVWFLYEVPLTAKRGQTLGKMALGIRVVGSSQTGRVGMGPATARWAILALPGLILGVFGLPIQAIDCGWMLTDKVGRRCLHDRPAKTYVIARTAVG